MTGYPRICCYSGNRSSGAPLLKADGTPDLDVLTKFSRYPMATLDIAPFFDPDPKVGRPDVLATLRRLSPTMKLGQYLLLGWTYMKADYPTEPNWMRRVWLQSLKDTNGIGADGFIRWDQPETERRLTADIVNVWRAHQGDFFFFDYVWSKNATASRAMQRCFHALREAGCPLIIGNATELDGVNLDGGMKEGFPGDLWTSSELNVDLWRSGRPEKKWDWLQAGTGLKNLDTPEAQRKARYSLGYACLRGMLCSIGPDRDLSVAPPYHTFWMAEYDGGGLGTGWLGEPIEEATQMGLYLWRRHFAGGSVIVNSGTMPVTVTPLPKGLCKFDGTEMGSVTVQPKDACFMERAR